MSTRLGTWRVGGVAVVALLLGGSAAWSQAEKMAGGTPAPPVKASPTARGWFEWRGPNQDGISPEKNLPDKWTPGGPNQLWSYPLAGRGTPVIAGQHVYAIGYDGEGPDLQEVLVCLDAATGQRLWEHRFNDFLSDIVYNRYSIGWPAADPGTGNVYYLTSAGIVACFSAEGKELWHHSMMEEYGRMTFPNGRAGGPAVDGDLVIIHSITSNWGADGPARDRFYAFDKATGDLVWTSTPGATPKDNSMSRPLFAWWNGRRVFYCGTGCGHIVCINADTGEPIWRFPLSLGGVNVTLSRYQDTLLAIHEDENLDSSEKGRMIALRIPAKPTDLPAAAPPGPGEPPAVVLPASAEVWRNELAALSSSPVVVGDRVYQVTKAGILCAVEAATGKVLWRQHLAADQLHASPLFADGKLYIPMWHDGLFIVRPGERGPEVLSHATLEEGEECLGAPAVAAGRVYLHTSHRLYCFGAPTAQSVAPEAANRETGIEGTGSSRLHRESAAADKLPVAPAPGAPGPAVNPAVRLQIVPSEVLLKPGEHIAFKVYALDALGRRVGGPLTEKPVWRKFIPPTAKVKSEMDAEFNAQGELVAGDKLSAGAFEATVGNLKGTFRGRVLPNLPIHQSFADAALAVPHETEKDAAGQPILFAYPPLPWIGARFKFEVRDLEGQKVLAKTLDVPLFQRATVFIGRPEERNYTAEADVMTDGTRRMMSIVGLINQRYLITLVGNQQEIEVSSTPELIKVDAPFKILPHTWYHLKTRVDVAADGSGVVRAKAWKKGEAEPAAWTIEAPHRHAHESGAPGFFGFALQSQYRVYLDNLTVTGN